MANRKRDKRKAELVLSGELLRYDLRLQTLIVRDGFQTGFELFNLARRLLRKR